MIWNVKANTMRPNRFIKRLSSIEDLPLATIDNVIWESLFPKLHINLPSGGYCLQDPNRIRVNMESYLPDLPMIEEIRRQAIGTILEGHIQAYSGKISSMTNYSLILDNFISFQHRIREDSDILFLGRLVCLFLNDTILRVGRVIRVSELVCNREDIREIRNKTDLLIPDIVLEKYRDEKISSCIACDFINVNVSLIREALY